MNTDPKTLTEPLSFVQTFIALLFVIGLIFLFTFFYKKISGHSTQLNKKNNAYIRMITSFPLGNRKYLAVVQIQEKHFLLGITQESINLLSDLDLKLENIPEKKKDFSNIFSKVLEKIK